MLVKAIDLEYGFSNRVLKSVFLDATHSFPVGCMLPNLEKLNIYDELLQGDHLWLRFSSVFLCKNLKCLSITLPLSVERVWRVPALFQELQLRSPFLEKIMIVFRQNVWLLPEALEDSMTHFLSSFTLPRELALDIPIISTRLLSPIAFSPNLMIANIRFLRGELRCIDGRLFPNVTKLEIRGKTDL